jgi:hypothetical protein
METNISSPPQTLMPSQLALQFRTDLNSLHAALLALSPGLAETPWRDGGWTRKQILGHMLDSAANNRQRFVRASIDGSYAGPDYAQEAWVTVHGYASQPWATLLDWWRVEHEILAAMVDRIPEEQLDASCTVGQSEPVTLRFLIEDYIRHQRCHLSQLMAPVVAP